MLCVYVLLLAGSAAMLMPLLWLVRSSFMGLSQIFIFPPEWIPAPWRWDDYPAALTTILFVRCLSTRVANARTGRHRTSRRGGRNRLG